MEIILAKHAGFCFGVKLAVDRAYKESENGDVATFGSIIHNKKVTEDLSKKGVKVVKSLNKDEVNNRKVILRSHGSAPEVYDQLKENNIDFIDCTCPDVKKIHNIVISRLKLGNSIIIFGNIDHPEIEAIKGWSGKNCIVVSSKDEIQKMDFSKSGLYSNFYSIVVQTTFNQTLFESMLEEISKKEIQFEVFNTICLATKKRQDEAREISKNVDVMVIIGDNESSNSKKLYEICKQNCEKTYFIETISDLDLNLLSINDKIGITAGASTPTAIIKEAIKLMSDFENIDDQSFEEMLNATFVTLHTGDIVKGTVISVSNGEVSVNLGFKSDGLIERKEFSDNPDVKPADEVKAGDEIEVYVMRVNDGEGNVLLSKKRVDSQKGMGDIEAAAGTDTVFRGKIIEIVKGGLITVLNGIRAFIPSSQISNRFVEDTNQFKGQEFDFNILEVDRAKRRVIAGRKELAKKELESIKVKVFDKLVVGEKATGTVSRIVDFGAFVDLGGIDGLIHISELSWGRVKKVTDIVSVGDNVTVTVLEANRDKGKISLSLRNASGNPWKDAQEKFAVGNIIAGKIVRMAPFGAFIELEEGVDGLVHISQISHDRVEKPEDILKVGEIVNVKVTELNIKDKKISLSIKATVELPEVQETALEETVLEETAQA